MLTLSQKKLEKADTLVLSQREEFIGMVWEVFLHDDSIYSIFPAGFDHIKLYDLEGEFLGVIDQVYVSQGKSTNAISRYSIHNGLAHIMYQGNFWCYQLDSNGRIIQVVKPELSDTPYIPMNGGGEPLYFSSNCQQYLVPLSVFGEQDYVFNHSKILG